MSNKEGSVQAIQDLEATQLISVNTLQAMRSVSMAEMTLRQRRRSVLLPGFALGALLAVTLLLAALLAASHHQKTPPSPARTVPSKTR